MDRWPHIPIFHLWLCFTLPSFIFSEKKTHTFFWVPSVGISSLDFGGISGWIMMNTYDFLVPSRRYLVWEVTALFFNDFPLMVKCLGQGHDLCSTYQSSPLFQSFFNLSSNQSSHGPRLWRLDQERIKFLLLLFHDVPPKNSCFMVPSWNIPKTKTHTHSAASCVVCVCVCVCHEVGTGRIFKFLDSGKVHLSSG